MPNCGHFFERGVGAVAPGGVIVGAGGSVVGCCRAVVAFLVALAGSVHITLRDRSACC
jgi:hypothetical protein